MIEIQTEDQDKHLIPFIDISRLKSEEKLKTCQL